MEIRLKIKYFSILKFLTVFLILSSTLAQQEQELLKQVIEKKLTEFPSLKETVVNFFPEVPNRSNYLSGNGFTKFAQTTTVSKYLDVSHEKLKPFLAFLAQDIQIPEDKKQAYIEKLHMTRFAKMQNLIINDLVFNVGTGKCKYVTIIGITNRDTKSTDWFIADVKLEFELAPDIAILHSRKCSLFGLIEDESTQYVAVPKSLTEKQILAVTAYFQIVTFQQFQQILDFKTTLLEIAESERLANREMLAFLQ